MAKKYLLFGLGRTNLALLDLILKVEPEVLIQISLDGDVTQVPINLRSLYLPCTELPNHSFDAIFVVPGVPASHPVYDMGQVHNEIEYAARFMQKTRFIGITGSVGKSTTTMLLSSMLRHLGYTSEVAGNIGIPLSSLAIKAFDQEQPDFVVLELSSFQLHVLKGLCLDTAILLNLEPNHLDWHRSYQEYQTDKLRIFDFLDAGRLGLCSKDLMHRPKAGKVLPLDSCHRGLGLNGSEIWFQNAKIGNVPEAVASFAWSYSCCAGMLQLLGLYEKSRFEDFSFSGLNHRMQTIGTVKGVRFIDDSKSTAPASTMFALRSMPEENFTLILGGKSKGVNLSVFIKDLCEFKQRISLLVLYGDMIPMALEFKQAGFFVIFARQWEEMLLGLMENREFWGSAVLLSPAMSSLDQFVSFEARGIAFREFIQKI